MLRGEFIVLKGHIAINRLAAADRLSRAQPLRSAKNLPEAMALVQEAVTIDPDFPNALFQYAVMLKNANRKEEAKPYFERALARAREEALPKSTIRAIQEAAK